MKKEKYTGYITFIKENNSKKDNYDEFLEKYKKNNVSVGEKIHSDNSFIVTKKIEESFHALSSSNMQEWDNLLFAKVESNEYELLDRFYYKEPAILTNDIEVISILSKNDVLNLIKGEIESRNTDSIVKYLKFIKFDENEKEFIKNNSVNGFGKKIGAAISYYQDEDKDAYKKANEALNKRLILSKNKEGK